MKRNIPRNSEWIEYIPCILHINLVKSTKTTNVARATCRPFLKKNENDILISQKILKEIVDVDILPTCKISTQKVLYFGPLENDKIWPVLKA
jgi:hypothetical protein